MPNINSKTQHAKNQVGGAEEPTTDNLYKIDHFKYALKIANRPQTTAVLHINRS